MKTFYAVIALALTTTTAMAQDAAPAVVAETTTTATVAADGAVTLSTEQQAVYAAFSPEQKQLHDSWPANVQAYFWTLSEPRQKAWWSLTDGQRTQVFGLDDGQREQVWVSIEAQLATLNAPAAPAAEPATAPAAN